ncbi:hypothetical protein ILYODFUR_032367 [Ilyodon furcidens]|uniref:Uncharacterized protein n=1 Tax=Ilyodon furcidens TaxID=33524 RepID=A0ABV0V8P1_9TELE
MLLPREDRTRLAPSAACFRKSKPPSGPNLSLSTSPLSLATNWAGKEQQRLYVFRLKSRCSAVVLGIKFCLVALEVDASRNQPVVCRLYFWFSFELLVLLGKMFWNLDNRCQKYGIRTSS